ncbi:MAG: hypothetical protein WBQ23_10840 [Bacteroidota bacterium]
MSRINPDIENTPAPRKQAEPDRAQTPASREQTERDHGPLHGSEEPLKPGQLLGNEEPLKPGQLHGSEEPLKPGQLLGNEEPLKPGQPLGNEEPLKPGQPLGNEEPLKPGQLPGNEKRKPAQTQVPDRDAALEQLRLHLRKRFLILLLPPGLLLAGLETARAVGSFTSLPYVDHPTWDVLLFVLAALFAIALPLLYRVMFANAHRGRTGVVFGAFYRFENNSMVVAMFSVWIAVGASLIAVQGYHMAGIFLLALYACYVFYPSRRRLISDGKVFRAGFLANGDKVSAPRNAGPAASEPE